MKYAIGAAILLAVIWVVVKGKTAKEDAVGGMLNDAYKGLDGLIGEEKTSPTAGRPKSYASGLSLEGRRAFSTENI